MAPPSSNGPVFKPKNKLRAQAKYHEQKKAKGKAERERNHDRRRQEANNPKLKDARLAKNVPHTIDSKRTWDEVDIEAGDGLGASVDAERILKRRKVEADPEAQEAATEAGALTETNLKKVEALESGAEDKDDKEGEAQDSDSDADSPDDDLGSLMNSGSEADADENIDKSLMPPPPKPPSKDARQPSPPASTTSTSLTHIPDALASRFPSIFHPPAMPKVLITTTIDSMLHREAEMLTGLFPNSTYTRRTIHKYRAYRPSIREICTGAWKRGYTAVMILGEDKKKPSSLQVVHLPQEAKTSPTEDGDPQEGVLEEPEEGADPSPIQNTGDPPPFGPTFTFSLKNFIPGKYLPGHGNPTDHHPELLLNNFRTPLGLLVASFLRTLFPSAPEITGRQVVTFHDQRDYIFVRRHRYIFRDRKGSEKKVVGSDGKVVKGAEEIRTGLQELGPRFTMKLRRIDEGVGYRSKEVWKWRAGDEKVRTRFAL